MMNEKKTDNDLFHRIADAAEQSHDDILLAGIFDVPLDDAVSHNEEKSSNLFHRHIPSYSSSSFGSDSDSDSGSGFNPDVVFSTLEEFWNIPAVQHWQSDPDTDYIGQTEYINSKLWGVLIVAQMKNRVFWVIGFTAFPVEGLREWVNSNI